MVDELLATQGGRPILERSRRPLVSPRVVRRGHIGLGKGPHWAAGRLWHSLAPRSRASELRIGSKLWLPIDAIAVSGHQRRHRRLLPVPGPPHHRSASGHGRDALRQQSAYGGSPQQTSLAIHSGLPVPAEN
jgi:hypothetical protein